MLPIARQSVLAVRAMFLTPLVSGMAGCISGSLASDTDRHPAGFRFSDRPRQRVHVGETVDFDFVLQDTARRLVSPTGRADYCAAIMGPKRVEAEPDLTGHFRFAHTFDGVKPGETVVLGTTAYRQRDRRDYMKVRGQWLVGDGQFDRRDAAVAGDSIIFTVYETPIHLQIVRPPDDLDPESGVLRIRRTDGTVTPVYIDRPHRPGFILSGPDPDGYYHVRYRPSGDELNPVGTTEVEFVIYDVAGHPYEVRATLETP